MILSQVFYALGINGNISMSSKLSYGLNVFYILCSCHICFFYFSFCFNIKPIFDKEKINLFKKLDLIVIFFICFSMIRSYKNSMFFYVSECKKFCRGVHYDFYAFIIFLPILIYLIINIFSYFKSKDYIEKSYIKSLVLFTIPPMIGELLSIFIPYSFVLLCSITISIILLYTTIQDIYITNDLLTGLTNRISLERYYYNEKIKNKEKQYLFLMDINKFKHINDNYGHLMGDKALQMFSDFLKKTVKEMGTIVCRYGGDEFILITKCKDNNEAQNIKNILNKKLEEENKLHDFKFKIKTSIGYAKYKNGITLNQWISKSDVLMYEDKNKS